MIRELDLVALNSDIVGEGLRAGDIGTVVLVHADGGFEVEFERSDPQYPAVLTLERDQVKELTPDEIKRCRIARKRA
jgi:hypothetical protein